VDIGVFYDQIETIYSSSSGRHCRNELNQLIMHCMESMDQNEFNRVFKYVKKTSIEEMKREKSKVTENRNVLEYESESEPFGE